MVPKSISLGHLLTYPKVLIELCRIYPICMEHKQDREGGGGGSAEKKH